MPRQLDGYLVVNVQHKDRAWNADLPSSPYVINELQLLRSTLKEGFRTAR